MTAIKTSISRRSVLAGGIGMLGVAAVPSVAFGALQGAGRVVSKFRSRPSTLANFLCDSVHDKMAANLDAAIGNPDLSLEEWKTAIENTKCPGCSNHVHPTKDFHELHKGAIA